MSLITKNLKLSFQDKETISGIFCPFCNTQTQNRTKRFKNTRSLYYHLREFHRNDLWIDFVIQLLHHVSVARQLRMIK